MRKIFRLILLCCAAFVLTGLPACGDDVPERAQNVIVPDGPRTPDKDNDQSGDDGNDNGDQNNDDPSPTPDDDRNMIVGSWISSDTNTGFDFLEDGTFSFYSPAATYSGTFSYSDLKRRLYLSANFDHEVRMIEYRCILDANNMTLYDSAGKQTILHRK